MISLKIPIKMARPQNNLRAADLIPGETPRETFFPERLLTQGMESGHR
ncbi:MAG: hypothetical protein ACPLRX_00045 [Candidatus Saccharicenans sp.]